VGIGLALSVTVAQLVFNRGAINPTLFIVGLAAYVYGIGTNMAGINTVLRIDLSLQAWQLTPFATLIDGLIIVGLSLVVEIFPESLLLWAIYPELRSPGDFISTLAGGMNIENRPQKRSNMSDYGKISSKTEQNRTKQNVLEQNKRFRTNGTFPYQINWTNIDRNGNAYKVLLECRDHWNKYGRLARNRTLVSRTGVSKGQVSGIVSKLKSGGFA